VKNHNKRELEAFFGPFLAQKDQNRAKRAPKQGQIELKWSSFGPKVTNMEEYGHN
jgi:hypothetical protein